MSHLGHRIPSRHTLKSRRTQDVERIFVHKIWRGVYWRHLVSTGRQHSMFCVLLLKIALSVAELMSFGHFGAAIWHHRTIIYGALLQRFKRFNIREAIVEIQLYTIDNVLKNWTDRVGYCMTSRGSHLNEIIFRY